MIVSPYHHIGRSTCTCTGSYVQTIHIPVPLWLLTSDATAQLVDISIEENEVIRRVDVLSFYWWLGTLFVVGCDTVKDLWSGFELPILILSDNLGGTIGWWKSSP